MVLISLYRYFSWIQQAGLEFACSFFGIAQNVHASATRLLVEVLRPLYAVRHSRLYLSKRCPGRCGGLIMMLVRRQVSSAG